ncbi:MAG TPA: hypothetical protein VEB86_14825, partial [Chryseosolibacter sp.]|nr:hypothetical protein [Chryseosolibacter sp.]
VELHNGVRYTFADTDSTFEKLVTFIKAERLCCDFFTFTLIAGEPGKLLLELTGPEGVKEFISEEVGF